MANDQPAPSPLIGIKRKVASSNVLSAIDNVEGSAFTASKTKRSKFLNTNPQVAILQEAIDKECLIRDGATKLLQLSNSTLQSMEASKSLFVSNMKLLELMKRLQSVQKDGRAKDNADDDKDDMIQPCQAVIAISDIRLPLEWKEFEHNKGKVDSKPGVFCLFRLGNQVLDTSLIEVDRSMVDISFPDTVVFPNKVDHNFTLIVEVYCSIPVADNSSSSFTSSGKESTPMKVLRKIKREFSLDHLSSPLSTSSSSLSLSPYVPPISTTSSSHHFTLAGHTQFTIKNVMGKCHTYNLTVGAIGSDGIAGSSYAGDLPLLPLWGQICCSVMAEPTCATQPRSTGFINVQQMVSGYPAWLRQWCVLRQHNLRCWTYPEDVGRKMPANTISMTKEMTVDNAPRLSMRRPNTLLIKDHETDQELYLSFESKEERDRWAITLKQAILDLKIWKDNTNYIINKQSTKFFNNDNNSPSFSRNNAFSRYAPPTETVL